MKTKIKLFIIVAVIIAVFFIFREPAESIPVVLHTVDKGIVESTVSNTRAGTVKACRRAKLTPPSGGQVASLNVKEGDKVAKGQLLLEIWNDDLRAQVLLTEKELHATTKQAEEVCLHAEAAAREEKRVMSLWKEGLSTEELVDHAQTQTKTSGIACSVANSKIEVSIARLEATRATLERTRLRAPFSGSIAEINGEVGEYVTPSPPGIITPPAVDMVDTSCLYILAPIDEVDAPAIVEGMEARITLDAFPDQFFLGAVRRIAPYVFELEKQARTVDIEAIFMDENQYKSLLPGYSADLEVILDTRHDVLWVPTEAIFDENKVYLFDDSDQTIHQTTVEKGLSNWKATEIIKGLKLNDKVVLSLDRKGIKEGVLVTAESNGE